MKRGRPTKYNKKLIDEICRRRADGESLRSICSDDDLPNRATVRQWLLKYIDFYDQYVEAANIDADNVFSDLIELSDSCDTPAMAALLKLRIDTRKWVLSRRRPKKFGEKIEQRHVGSDTDSPIQGNITMTFVRPGDIKPDDER